jgi:hypothetical protein
MRLPLPRAFLKIFYVAGALLPSSLLTMVPHMYVQALDILVDQYDICHIQISPYNLQANSVVEQHHYDVREAIIKSTLGEEVHWPLTAHSVFWAEQVTILKATRLSLYFMVHGVEPLFPFDLRGDVSCSCPEF